jgi:thiol-disulfide isomerase/thioredoxin
MSAHEPTPASQTPRSAPTSRVWLIGAVLAAAWCVYLVLFGPKTKLGDLPQPILTPPSGSLAEYRWDVTDLDGKAVDFANYRGKPMLLNVWATWCPPCVAELPSINNLAANDRLKGLPIVCVSVDDDRAAVSRFAEKNKMRMTVLHANGPPPSGFRTDGIPATFIIDGDGRVVVREVGAAQWDAPEVVDLLEKLLKQGAFKPK